MSAYIGYFPIASQSVAVSSTNAQSAALHNQTRQVRLAADTDCFIAIGANPTATTSSVLLPAGVVEYFTCHEGDLVAVIQKTAAGTLNIAEMVR